MSTGGVELTRLSERIDAVDLRVGALEARVAAAPKAKDDDVASAAELDGPHGDEEIRKDPSAKYWSGTSHTGLRMSMCGPDYLEAFAKYKSACAYMNEKSGDPAKAKYIEYDRRDARRARGWRARLLAGYKPVAPADKPTQVPMGGGVVDAEFVDDEIPFISVSTGPREPWVRGI